MQNIPPTGSIYEDTLLLILYDENGKPIGKKAIKIISMIFNKKNYIFPSTGVYTLLVTHGMRDSILPGIIEIGFKFEKVNKNER